MPTIKIPNGAKCQGVPMSPLVEGCDGSSREQWEILDQPAGSELVFSQPNSSETAITVNVEGAYTVRLCCYFDEGDIAPPDDPPFAIGCPKGVIAGQPAAIGLTGCTGTVEWSAGGVATGVAGDESGATVTTDLDGPGTATVTVTCTNVDVAGNVETLTETCEFTVEPSDTEFLCVTSPPIDSTFIACGRVCECAEATIVFDCREPDCLTAEIGLVFRECPPCIDDEVCEEIEFSRITAQNNATLNPCREFIEMNCEVICCEPHRPVLHWGNVCALPGWTLDAPAIDDTSIYNTCNCNPGQKWCFEGSATIFFTGEEAAFIDTLVIWGHNIVDGEITTSPLSANVSPRVVRPSGDASGLDSVIEPIIIDFADVEESTALMAVTITSNTPGPVCIDQIFLGRKLYLPDDLLPISFQNPHNGIDYELEIKSSECGPVSRSLKHVPVDFSLEFECSTEEWIKEVWRPYLRYAMRHGVLFRWSRNRCPSDIFNGWITGPVGPSIYGDSGEQSVTIEAKGYITQPQPKIIANNGGQ